MGNNREKVSLNEVVHGVLSRKNMAAAVIVGGMILSACGFSVGVNNTPNATATETQPRVTETVELGATETPTLAVTPTMEMSPTPENVEYAEIDERIKEFLDSEGQYSDEALAKLPHMGFDRKIALEGNYLGILKTVAWIDTQPYVNTEDWSKSEATQVFYQGVFLGGILENDRVVVFMGMKDKEGNRIVVPIGRNVFPEDGNTLVNRLTIGNYDGGAWDINNPSDSVEEIFASNADRLFGRYGEVAVFDCLATPLAGKTKESFAAYGDRTSDKINEIDGSVPLCRTLFNKVIDVRQGKDMILDEATENVPIYTDSTFKGIQEIADNPDSDIAYSGITFVRP